MAKRSMGVKAAIGLAMGVLASFATAQTSSSTSTAPSTTYTVAVAADGFRFNPDQITANVGDIILYEFYQGNHSVARAEFEDPCIPYENLGGGRVGFWSGFQPVVGIPEENGPKFALRINSTEPIFFYCSAPGACVPNGMIGVINPNATQTLAIQELFVKNASYQLSPGEAPPPESTSTPSPTPPPGASGGSGLSKGAIAGIAVGAVAVIALAALTFYLCGRNRTLASVVRYSQPPQPKHPSALASPMSFSPGSPHPENPYSQSPTQNYSPGPKPAMVANVHDSWQTQNTQPHIADGGFRSVSPGHPSPGAPWSPGGYGGQQYSPVPHQEMATGQEQYLNSTPQQSPGLHHHDSYLSTASQQSQPYNTSPHNQSRAFSPVPQHGGEYHQQQQHQAVPIVHEMDAAPTIPPTSPPPEYIGRSFSFAEGGPGETPGVEKVLRD